MRAVTVNVSAASPFGNLQRRVAGMAHWASQVIASAAPPSLVFAQECSAEWLDVWRQAGYQVVLGDAEGQTPYRVISALIASEGLGIRQVTVEDAPSLAYHGSYIAAATWQPVAGDPILLMSVHASPTRAERYLSRWPVDLVAAPVARTSNGRTPGALWDADAVLATLRHHAGLGQVLTAGDLNEALGWEDAHPGDTSGEDYFLAVREAGLIPVLHERWGPERPTRRVGGVDGMQLDHILATRPVADRITEPEIDKLWASAPDHDDWSDHAPVWFSLAV